MTCLGPLTAYRPKAGSGDKRLVFDKRKSETGIAIKIPCGQCAGCRLESSRQWAMRAMHEKQMHNRSAFLTLTYNDKCLPPGGSLSLDDYQKFMKRLRWKLGPVRFLGCGEYGDTTRRAHYHILLLNCDFTDKLFHKLSPSGARLYVSRTLDALWSDERGNLGHSLIGDVEFDSCAYVARYVMKKIKGQDVYGERLPPFLTMSRNPGLGATWFEKYGGQAYNWDSVIVNGMEVRPPKFYDSKVKSLDPDKIELLKKRRRRKAAMHKADNTVRRLRVREVVMMAKLNLKGRSL